MIAAGLHRRARPAATARRAPPAGRGSASRGVWVAERPAARSPREQGRPRDGGCRGFTLIEIAVALAVLGLVVSTVYLALGGAISGAERLREAQEPYQRGRVARSFLAGALRSAAPFVGVPEDGFVSVDSTHGGLPRDELTFVALAPAEAGGSRMQVRLFVADSAGTPALRLQVRDLLPARGDSLPPFRTHTLSTGVAGLDLEYLAAAPGDESSWLETWETRIRLPYAIRIWFLPAAAPDPAYRTPLLVQIPVGRRL